MFDWDDIQVFLAVAKTGTVRGASRDLGITHATVSRRLHQLEDKLDAQLFDRTSTKHQLSTVGLSVHSAALKARENMAEISRLAFAQDTRLAGIVKFSVLESLYMAVLHPYLKEFQLQNPLIEIELITTEQLKNLAQREADIVIRITTNPPDHAYGRKLANSPLACYASPEYLKNRPELDCWVALEHEPANKPTIPARTILTSNSLTVAAETIKSGRGIGLLPCFMGDNDPGLVRMPNSKLIPDMEIWALMHEDVQNTPRVRLLMDFIYDVFSKEKDRIEGKDQRLS